MEKKLMNRFKDFFHRHQLGFFILIAIIVSVALTVISVSVYITSGAINVDCSLPTDAEICKKVIVDDENEKSFSPNGFFNEQAIEDFNAVYEDIKSGLDKMGSFGADAISDEALDLK